MVLEAPTHIDVEGVRIPRLLYGTAWKEGRTAALTGQALAAGFRGIDTANQRRHYHEAGVGEAVRAVGLPREALFLQSKFTFVGGQDHRLPYDPAAPLGEQVRQSFASSLEHLGVEHLDAYLLHGPSQSLGLGAADWDAWDGMQDLHRSGVVRLLGVSNVNADHLEELLAGAKVKPRIVQNRCFTRPHADWAVREACREHGIVYEGFSLLTGHALVRHPTTAAAAARSGCTPAQAVFRYCLDRGIVVLTGTTSEAHMREDLAVLGLDLPQKDAKAMDGVLGVPSRLP